MRSQITAGDLNVSAVYRMTFSNGGECMIPFTHFDDSFA